MSINATKTHNRIEKHFTSPQRELPKSEYDRYAFFGDAVLDAVGTLRELLRSENEATSLKAAELILAVQQTSIRHGRPVATCTAPIKEHRPDVLNHPVYYGEESEPVKETPAEEFVPFDELDLPGGPPTEEEAFASHVKEAERMQERVAKLDPKLAAKLAAIPNSAAICVRDQLKEWKKKATDIPLGGFMRAVMNSASGAASARRENLTTAG